jgi:hypothetical protein
LIGLWGYETSTQISSLGFITYATNCSDILADYALFQDYQAKIAAAALNATLNMTIVANQTVPTAIDIAAQTVSTYLKTEITSQLFIIIICSISAFVLVMIVISVAACICCRNKRKVMSIESEMLKLQQKEMGQMPNKGEKVVVEKQLDFGSKEGYLPAHSHTQSSASDISEAVTQVVADTDGGDRNEKKDQHVYKRNISRKKIELSTGKTDWEEISELDNERNQEAAALKLKSKLDLEYERLNSQIQMR